MSQPPYPRENKEKTEESLLASFDRLHEFTGLQSQLLGWVIEETQDIAQKQQAVALLPKLQLILYNYQEQAYLVDPHLDILVPPVVHVLRQLITDENVQDSTLFWKTNLLSELLYVYMNFRGYKTILRFFPHELGDLLPTLNLMKREAQTAQDTQRWHLRYVVLLWLSLICMIPFDLSLFDDTSQQVKTAVALQEVGEAWLDKYGLERFAAAQLLSRLYMRKDMASELIVFFHRAQHELNETTDSPRQLGYLQVLCQVAKTCPTDLLQNVLQPMIDLARITGNNVALMRNTIGRQLRVKLLCRSVVRVLPAKAKERSLRGLSAEAMESTTAVGDESGEDNVPEVVEAVIGELLDILQDKATTVRWTAAKGFGRIAARLPIDFAEQTTEALLSLFSIHSAAFASTYDLPEIAEATWHGACLACAELSRRDLIDSTNIGTFIDWMIKALYFDIRKGSHSIGSSVRDAGTYALWSTARIGDTLTLEPYAVRLAENLAVVAAFDREVQIRRAASAAYQEFAGRTNLFPSGIDVLSMADFFSVGIRRNSFLVVAPGVAQIPEYQSAFINHLLTIVLRHWDQHVRQLGALSLSRIVSSDPERLLPGVVDRAAVLLDMSDVSDIHGGLAALSELARDQPLAVKQTIFGHLNRVPSKTVLSPRNHMVTEAACLLISTALTRTEIELGTQSVVPHWRRLLDHGLRHRTETVQVAAAAAVTTVTGLVDCSSMLSKLIAEFGTGSPTLQQSLGRLLGQVDYQAFPQTAPAAISCLLESVDSTSSNYMKNIEARRNCYESMPSTVNYAGSNLNRDASHSMFRALLAGLADYTIDERGDVGSWARMACIQSLTTFIRTITEHARSREELEGCLPADMFQSAIGGILKQGVERLDNVRQHAGEQFVQLLQMHPPRIEHAEAWSIANRPLLEELFLGDGLSGWNNSAWLYPRAVRLLDIQEYRAAVLDGLVLSIASRTDSTQRPASASFFEYVLDLPVNSQVSGKYSVMSLIDDLLRKGEAKQALNAALIPVLQVLLILIEGDGLSRLSEDEEAVPSLHRILAIATRNAARIKNTQRVNLSMKIAVHMLLNPLVRKSAVTHLSTFLAHEYPKVRSDTAEYLYLILSTNDMDCNTDEVEEILLETEWSVCDMAEAARMSDRVTELLLASV